MQMGQVSQRVLHKQEKEAKEAGKASFFLAWVSFLGFFPVSIVVPDIVGHIMLYRKIQHLRCNRRSDPPAQDATCYCSLSLFLSFYFIFLPHV